MTSALPSPVPKFRRASASRSQNPFWSWIKHPEIRGGRRLVPRWPQGSTPGYVSRKVFRADASAGGARRAGTKPFVRESNARAGQARARPWLQLLRERVPKWPSPQRRVRGRGDGWCTVRTLGNGNGCAHQWGVGDSQKVAGLEVGRATDGQDLSP